MRNTLQQILAEEHIDSFAIIKMEDVRVIHPHLLPHGIKTVIMLAVPYDTREKYTDGVSAYAHAHDYHVYFSELFARILPKLQALNSSEHFYGFTDHSPIHEKDAAAKAGLGIIGHHSLLIHPQYGSYLFLGSILTTMELEGGCEEIKYCDSCGLCKNACPVGAISDHGIDAARCLSAISQKKNLAEEDRNLLRQHHVAWGCDVCQNHCPYNAERQKTTVPYFVQHRHEQFIAEEVRALTEDDFRKFAFSWRGRNRIIENLQNLALGKENSNN